jgi:hypothetical protein
LGTYKIKVIGTLPDQTTTSFIFTINVIRRLLSKVIYLKLDLIASNPSNFTLPFIFGFSDEYVNHTLALPDFVNFFFPEYTIFPSKV